MGTSVLIRKILIIFFVNFLYPYTFAAKNEISIVKGVLDLRGNKFQELTQLNFTGEWEFYWEKLLFSEDFQDSIPQRLTCYQKVPSVWADVEVDGQNLPAHGYCTYRIKVLTDSVNLNLALRIGSIGSACKIFIDDELLFEGGKVGTSKEKTVPGYATGVKFFNNKSKDFNLIIQVANFHYSVGGIWSNINSIGKEEYVLKTWETKLEIRLFLMGSIIVISIYFFGLFFFNRNFKSALLFGFFCVDVAFRNLLLEELYILKLIPNVKWDIIVRLEYLTLPIGAIIFLLFFHEILTYGKIVFLRIAISLNSISLLVILFLNVNSFSKGLMFYQLILIVSALYAFYLVVHGLIRKDRIAMVVLIALIVFVGTLVNDILYVNRIINTLYLTTYGFMFFIFMQAYIVSYRFLKMFNHTKELAENLETINLNLEQSVVERTQEIQAQHDILLVQNDEITSQRDSIELQNIELIKQKQLITDSIDYAQRIQKAILPSEVILSGHLSEHFIFYKPKDIVSGDFYWFTKKDNKLILVAADCTGHGVPGAFMSMLGIAFLAEISKLSKVKSASQILEFLREKVKLSLRQYDSDSLQKEGIDLALCIYDPKAKILEFSGAYNPLYLIRNKELQIIAGDRQPASVHFKERPFTDKQIKVLPNDAFYIFSDGFQDQIGGSKKKKYGIKKFQKVLIDIHEKPMEEQKLILEDTLKDWIGDFPQIDDILVIGFRLL